MAVLRIGGNEYRTEKLELRDQFHVFRRLHPIVGAIRESILRGSLFFLGVTGQELPKGNEENDENLTEDEKKEKAFDTFGTFVRQIDAIEPFTTALGKMDEADADYVMNKCLSKAYRIVRSATGEAQLYPVLDQASGRMMYEDITLDVALQLVWSVANESLGNFSFVNHLFPQSG